MNIWKQDLILIDNKNNKHNYDFEIMKRISETFYDHTNSESWNFFDRGNDITEYKLDYHPIIVKWFVDKIKLSPNKALFEYGDVNGFYANHFSLYYLLIDFSIYMKINELYLLCLKRLKQYGRNIIYIYHDVRRQYLNESTNDILKTLQKTLQHNEAEHSNIIKKICGKRLQHLDKSELYPSNRTRLYIINLQKIIGAEYMAEILGNLYSGHTYK